MERMQGGEQGILAIILIIYVLTFLLSIAMAVFMMICRYKVFKKAGQEGIYAIVPIYNLYILCKIVGKDTNHFILHLIPFVNIYAIIVTYMALAKSFGKDDGFGIGLFLLGIIFWPWLAYGKDIQYLGPGGINQPMNSSNSLTNTWQNPDKPANV